MADPVAAAARDKAECLGMIVGSHVASLLPGTMVWDRGQGEFGDSRTGGCVVRIEANADGESQVTVITNAQGDAKHRRPTLIVHHTDGRKGTRRPAYEAIGPVARLVRMPVADIDPGASDGFRDPVKVLDHARHALFASAVALLPDYFDRRAHDDFLTAYRVLRAEADLLARGVA